MVNWWNKELVTKEWPRMMKGDDHEIAAPCPPEGKQHHLLLEARAWR